MANINPISGGAAPTVLVMRDTGAGSPTVVNVTPTVHEFHVRESIFNNSISAVVTCYDSAGTLLNQLPVTGQEIVVISAGSNKYTLRLQKVESLSPTNQERAYSYNIHCSSLDFEASINKSIFNHFNGQTGSSIASAVFSEHCTFGRKSLSTESSENLLSYTAAGHNPFEFINMVAADSVSGEFPDQSLYLFYEDRNGYHFKTVNKMLTRSPVESFHYADPGTERGPNARNYIVGVTWHNMADSINGLRNGLFDSTLIAFDINTKVYKEYKFNYTKQFNELTHIQGGGQPFVRAKSWQGQALGDALEGSSHTRLIRTDFNLDIENQTFDGRIDDTKDPHIFHSKNKQNFILKATALLASLKQHRIDVTSHFTPSVKPGDVVNVYLPNNDGNGGGLISDRYFTGYGQRNPTFLVTGVITTYEGVDGNLFTTLECSKESLGRGLGGAAATPSEPPVPPEPQQKADYPYTTTQQDDGKAPEDPNLNAGPQ